LGPSACSGLTHGRCNSAGAGMVPPTQPFDPARRHLSGAKLQPDELTVAFDDERLVADAGLLLPATLAVGVGLRKLLDTDVDLGGARAGACRRQGNDHGAFAAGPEGAVLRSKTPDGVAREVYAHLLSTTPQRALMHQTALDHDLDRPAVVVCSLQVVRRQLGSQAVLSLTRSPPRSGSAIGEIQAEQLLARRLRAFPAWSSGPPTAAGRDRQTARASGRRPSTDPKLPKPLPEQN
jgi:hypothetical protein